jgi:8-hydroxy-5-deazaflavin:NADPH oxidoreductase
MKIGFIGTGNMAAALASKWQGKHDLFFGGRDLAKADALAERFGAQSGSLYDAVGFGDALIVSLPGSNADVLLTDIAPPEEFSGKTVIDITNPIDVATFLSTRPGTSMTLSIANLLPDTYVGKAFNMAHTSVWESDSLVIGGQQYVALYTADDNAVPVIEQLIRDVGAVPKHIGNNGYAYQLEAAAAIVIRQLFSGAPGSTILNLVS